MFIMCDCRGLYFSGSSCRTQCRKSYDIINQVRITFESLKHTLSKINATLDDIVEIKFYLKNKDDFRKGADVFREYFTNGAPARMTIFTDFLDDNCLCMMDGIAYKQN